MKINSRTTPKDSEVIRMTEPTPLRDKFCPVDFVFSLMIVAPLVLVTNITRKKTVGWCLYRKNPMYTFYSVKPFEFKYDFFAIKTFNSNFLLLYFII